jgi:hypothetical protein
VLSEGLLCTEVLDSSYGVRICAVIVTYNIREAIHRCFDAIQSQFSRTVLVDNGEDELIRSGQSSSLQLSCIDGPEHRPSPILWHSVLTVTTGMPVRRRGDALSLKRGSGVRPTPHESIS